MNRAERLARLLRVLAAIIAEPGLNPLELADRAGVSERTLRRDLAQLRELGYEVAYTSGYEVQEKLNLDGRAKRRPRGRGDDALLQAVAQAVETAGLWRDTEHSEVIAPRRSKTRGSGPAALVMIPSGEHRRKSVEEAAAIRQAQQAAEAAVVAVVRELAQANIKDGVLWSDGAPLTAEHLYARAQYELGEIGFTCPDMIVAGSPDNALPHYRGDGAIKANAPVIIDSFPTSRTTHLNVG